MAEIKGVQITLYENTKTGVDEFNAPIYSEQAIQVDNVLIAPASAQEILDTVNLYGKKAVYTLGIPKTDTHDWMDKHVSFFGQEWRTFGIPLEGIEANIPLDWNKKVTVERYE